jgi:hypothetical protein
VEAIALLAGHNQTATTELVYRHQIVPALTRGAEVMDQIFDQRPLGLPYQDQHCKPESSCGMPRTSRHSASG